MEIRRTTNGDSLRSSLLFNFLSLPRRSSQIECLNYEADGVRVKGMVPTEVAMRLRKWNVDKGAEGEGEDAEGEDEVDWARIGKGRH